MSGGGGWGVGGGGGCNNVLNPRYHRFSPVTKRHVTVHTSVVHAYFCCTSVNTRHVTLHIFVELR